MLPPISLVVLLATLVVGIDSLAPTKDHIVDTITRIKSHNSVVTSCVTNCTCTPSIVEPQVTKLIIDCSSSTIGNSSFVVEAIDRLLANRESELTDLTIVNSPLESVPSSICQLTRLNRLVLERNRLTSLPLGCFNNMTSLTSFEAGFNRITELQDGLFDGLSSLYNLDLANNLITTIGLNVFTAEAGLSSLHDINFKFNRLTELEPWPFIRGQLVAGSNIILMQCEITTFTNRLKWSFRCGMKSISLTLNLKYNPIDHTTDILNGWNITGMVNWYCLYHQRSASMTVTLPSLACDCIDYEWFYFYRRLSTTSSFFNGALCSKPPALETMRIHSVPLDQFVCEVDYPVCPAGCQCIKRPYNQTYIVKCPDAGKMPITLPDTRHPGPLKCQYALDFRGSKLDTIDYREYFNNTVTLDVSGSSVNNITDDAWRAFSRFKHVDLSNNELTVLPTLLQYENLTFKSIALYGNPWRCQCEDRWIGSWLESLGDGLLLPDLVLCNSPTWLSQRSVFSVKSEDEFCFDPYSQEQRNIMKVAIPSSVGSLLLVICLVSIVLRYRVAMFVRFNLHPFDVDECHGEDMIYDVFLICAHEDRDVGRKIVERLENGDALEDEDQQLFRRPTPGFKVCYHERDFLPGEYITASIQTAIEKSKRVVCLLTTAFFRSEYCMLEFRAAWDHCLKLKKRRLVVIKWQEVDEYLADFSRRRQGTAIAEQLLIDDNYLPDSVDIDQYVASQNAKDVQTFLSTYTYIDYSREDWWSQLIYSLPTNRLEQPDDAPAPIPH